jgi:exosortase/archaeosortase family protein
MALRTQKNSKDASGVGKKQPKGISITRFLITYVILMNVFFFFYLYKPIVDIINIGKVYNHFVVVSLSKMLNAVGLHCTYQGFVIMLPTVSLDVKFGCNGLEAVMIYSIAVLAYPAGWKKKLTGIVAGFIVIQIANFLRMIMLAYSGMHLKNLFDYIHIYIAQGVMIALALGIFFVYLNYANAPKKAYN